MVDPTISIGHNVQTLLLNDNSLPPDLKWEQSVENEATRVAQIAMFDNQVRVHTQSGGPPATHGVSCIALVCQHSLQPKSESGGLCL